VPADAAGLRVNFGHDQRPAAAQTQDLPDHE